MSTAVVVNTDPRIQSVRVTRDQIIADLVDGRVISVPLAWSWRLSEATPAQRANFRLIGTGQGVNWPDIDEDLSVEGLLHGSPAPRPRSREELSRMSSRKQHDKRKRRWQIFEITPNPRPRTEPIASLSEAEAMKRLLQKPGVELVVSEASNLPMPRTGGTGRISRRPSPSSRR